MGFLLDSLRFPWYFYDISLGLLWNVLWGVNGISMGSYGVSKDAYGISIGFLWDFHDVSMIFLEDFCGISEGMLWEFNGILMGFPLGSYEVSMVFL